MKTNQILVSLKGVQKSYDDHIILRELNLEVRDIRRDDNDNRNTQQAQVVSILGPSGIGKTTLFRLLAGLEKPDKGTVLINDPYRLLTNETTDQHLIPARAGLSGVVYQDYILFEFLKVRQLLMLGAKQSGEIMSQEDTNRLVNEYLEKFQLTEHADKFPAMLSGGQKQRVAIAQQMLCKPQLLLLDEPFSGLDPVTKKDVMNLICEISHTNEYLSIVIISHDISSAIKVSDTIYLIGRARNTEHKIIPGAYIHHDRTVDLAKMGVAWKPELWDGNEFFEITAKIENLFPYLSGLSDD